MAMGMGPQAGHDVYIRREEDENCCTLAQCRITYYIFFSVLGILACLFAVLVLFSGLQWMGLLVMDLIILGVLWGTFCCVYGCCFKTKLVVHSGAHHGDPAAGVQMAYPAHMQPAPGGVVQQGYPVHVHQGYPVPVQPAAPPPAPAQPWPQPSTPPGPKLPTQTTPYPSPYPQTQPGSSSWQAPTAP